MPQNKWSSGRSDGRCPKPVGHPGGRSVGRGTKGSEAKRRMMRRRRKKKRRKKKLVKTTTPEDDNQIRKRKHK